MHRVNCFAFEKNGCKAVSRKHCFSCPFYKTVDENKKACKEAMKRVASLDSLQFEHIKKKYYRDLEDKQHLNEYRWQ